MTSLQFYNETRLEPRPVYEWGTGETKGEKFDPTLITSPTFLLRNQPIEQHYRESNLELSNLRSNDQLVPNTLSINFVDHGIKQKFPGSHPLTSQISYKAVFPNFIAPEDVKHGDKALNAKPFVNNPQAPAQVEKTIVVNKQSGKPYRHEIKLITVPSKQSGLWYNDKEYYHNPKPDYNTQQYYPAPPKLLVPNPELRNENLAIDERTANVLRNKSRELIQSTQRTSYYIDGIGTRSQIKSDDLLEKMINHELTGKVDETLRPYFRKGQGLTKFTSESTNSLKNEINNTTTSVAQNASTSDLTDVQTNINYINPKLITQVEKDEMRMETGKDYINLPCFNYKNVPTEANYNLLRANTISDLRNASNNTPTNYTRKTPKSAKLENKLKIEMDQINKENHDRLVKLELTNRKKEIDSITPANDIKILRIKHKELENARGAKPNLKQNINHHVNTLYQNESKYLGERAELYRTENYNPYILKAYVEGLKDEPKVAANFINGAGLPTQNNVSLTEEKNEKEPKLFADKVFQDFKNLKREPLESKLTTPELSSSHVVQENGIIQKQSTYGQSYNTKKYLQENELVGFKRTAESLYKPKDQADIDYQDITLKSEADQVALNDYKSGLTSESNNLTRAHEIVTKKMEETKEHEKLLYPRLVGPIPPVPYEEIYCNNEITEMSDGYSKRFYQRVYESPHLKHAPQGRYAYLESDIRAMEKYETKLYDNLKQNERYINELNEKILRESQNKQITHRDLKTERARRSLDNMSVKLREQHNISTYTNSYLPYEYKAQENCPQNEFFKNVSYADPIIKRVNNEPLPNNLISLQDKWSKSLANKLYNSTYSQKCPDLRDNIKAGKKIIKDSPLVAAKYANFKS